MGFNMSHEVGEFNRRQTGVAALMPKVGKPPFRPAGIPLSNQRGDILGTKRTGLPLRRGGAEKKKSKSRPDHGCGKGDVGLDAQASWHGNGISGRSRRSN
jgi:hypothetical protein